MKVRRRVPGWLAVLLLILFWPVGIALAWRTTWTERAKVATTVAVVALVALVLLPFNIAVPWAFGEAISNPSTYKTQPSPRARPAAMAAATPRPTAPVLTATSTPSPTPSAAPTAAPTATPTAGPPLGPRATTVVLTDNGPWIAGVTGFDLDDVRSVTYYVRDAGQHWHAVGPVTTTPYQAPLPWWTWDNGGREAVTAHVQLQGQGGTSAVRDPGGWSYVDGRRFTPQGRLEVVVNSDDSLGLRYVPARASVVMSAVQFWMRVGGQWRQVADVPQSGADGSFEVPSVAGTESGAWKADDTAVSVHVVWPGGRQSIDPAPWVWRDHFGQAPLVALPQDLQVSGPVTGPLTLGVNPHSQASDDPRPSGNVPTWTRCAVFNDAAGRTTFFEADIVGSVGDKAYALSILNEDSSQYRIPGTYTRATSGSTPIEVALATTDGGTRWGGGQSVAAVIFADRASGSINAHLVGPDGGGQQPIDISGTWRCGGAGPVAATVPPLPPLPSPPPAPPVTKAPTASPTEAPATAVPAPPPATAPPPPPPAPVAPAPAPAGCSPHTNSGGCYQPGEFCRNSDHNQYGRTASGEAIVCTYNNGWRWEPA